MSASTLNLPVIEKGATYRHTLTWTDSTGTAINLAVQYCDVIICTKN